MTDDRGYDRDNQWGVGGELIQKASYYNYLHESEYFFSPLHALACTQASSFNCTVNGPIGSEYFARV